MNERHESLWARCRGQREHLSEDALLDVMIGRASEPGQRRSRHVDHVETCGLCDSAVSQLESQWSLVGAAGRLAADDVIGADRLARQMEIIERRLDGQPGRVLPFPVQARVSRSQPRVRRWVAMAAASGLLFGLAAGRLLGPASAAPNARTVWGSPAPTTHPTAAVRPVIEPAVADEHLLVEVDAALARAVHREFLVLDELTPRSADVLAPAGRRP